MRTTPEMLAAIAAAAVPGIAPVATGPSPDDNSDFRSCVVKDTQYKRWRVRSPLNAEASIRLETEHLVLGAFTPSVRAHLPFHLPSVVGSVEQSGLRTFVYSHLPGTTLTLGEMSRQNENPVAPSRAPAPSAEPRAPLAVQVGRALAAVHSLPRALVMDADLPAYSAEQCRSRMLHDLDRAAATGRIPGQLLRRWEQALEDTTLWRFSTRVVHGDLHEDNVIVHEGALGALTGWSDLHVGDPAVDFAWLVGMANSQFADTALETYSVAAVQPPDRHLLRRAHLSAEFALAEWLVRGVDRGVETMIKDAERMLNTLALDVERTGSPAPGVIPEPPAAEPEEQSGPEGSAPGRSGSTDSSAVRPVE
ncbi:macrolide 2'-phosphotransferase [Kocuria sp. cx-455]|uniref:macrolide 2'-phosphotransferase n=1 Tax=Kocuria sp. cx-455 TaxID=2771377 RepID=UPI002805D8D1|nr:macrolide 2'-phosphotransferase [Kocuria sp. cx-455]